jgi:hypothetical protein
VWVDLVSELKWSKRTHRLVEKFVGKPTQSFLEGPAFDADGNLFACGQIIRISPAGKPAVNWFRS